MAGQGALLWALVAMPSLVQVRADQVHTQAIVVSHNPARLGAVPGLDGLVILIISEGEYLIGLSLRIVYKASGSSRAEAIEHSELYRAVLRIQAWTEKSRCTFFTVLVRGRDRPSLTGLEDGCSAALDDPVYPSSSISAKCCLSRCGRKYFWSK